MLDKNTKIYVAGHRGLVGSAIWNNLKARGYNNLIGRTHRELDLTDEVAVRTFFDEEQPEAVVLAAAFVGGIMANSLYRADFLMQNMKMQCNVISNAYSHGVKKLLFLGSTCIYPKNAPQPMREDALLTSELEYTNEEYAIAKIAGLKMCESYNLQYGTNYIAVMPTNLYGPNDNFHLENSHVMPAMMRKVYLAKLLHDNNWQAIRNDMDKRPINPTDKLRAIIGDGNVDGKNPEERIVKALAYYGIEDNKVTLWGTGSPLREFLWSEDMADASVYLLLNVDFKDVIGIEKYSSVFYGAKTDGSVDRNNSEGRGGAIPSLGEIRNCHINVGTGKELTIKALSELVVKAVGFEGEVVWDSTKPDGTPRKLIDVSKLHSLGWTHKVEIEDGVRMLFDWYQDSLK
ncbi:MAG: GDP-L-fucose synthase [Prevotella sp.]|uniref:GDP-L-fucose synthase family protein n=1 Tax=Prevotella sp. P3-122 TaxID=2024223 RepID=UPI000B9697AF|nr:GDP-L-fucose synthase [Prevotella sp. P3-122]MCI6182129.1 GDP-L-fucose synthase [Prevotella sp.]MCI6309765.1 GDP-L-fucose synthase [Prevotella sp.]MCI6463695.1 GDP-L-fucose synthase [Prevotella sp.]MCI6500548.1 GDP-L-fucose synthase [Prevotella sp.]MCI7341850.1 GDP-L-fucose synthase [Prevotella sp.]